MGRFTRQEIEEAFERYQQAALKGGTTGDWNDWADLFTEDATYVEHLYGRLGGREAIRRWIQDAMSKPIHNEMIHFPVEWYIVDEDRAWVVCQVWNRMKDPGDGSLHQAYNFTLLKYAGNGRWSYEEDIYNPEHFKTMIRGWMTRKKEVEKEATAES